MADARELASATASTHPDDTHDPLAWNCIHIGCGALNGQECRWASDDGPRHNRFHEERMRAAKAQTDANGDVLLVPSVEMIDAVAEELV